MRRQISNDAIPPQQLFMKAAEQQSVYSTYLNESSGQPDEFNTKDDQDIPASIFSAVSSYSKNTCSIWDVCPEGGFALRYANPQYLKMCGLTDEAFGKKLNEIYSAKAARKIQKRFIECIRCPHEMEFVHDLIGGRMLSTRIVSQINQGRVTRLICSGIDVTEYVREQRRLKAESEQLERQSRMLSTQLKFESIITRALRELMDAGSAGFDGCLYGLCSELGNVLGTDQNFIFQKRSGRLFVHKAYWSRVDRPLYASPNQMHAMQANGFGMAHLTRLLTINDTHTAKGFSGAENLQAMNIRALLAMPIRRESQEFGLLCLVQMEKPRVWTTAEISLVKTAADVIMSAYQRLHLESGLRENLQVLTEYDESLQELLAQKETLAGAAQDFLRAGTGRFAECVPRVLRDIGRLLDADGIRVLVRNSEEDTAYFSWREEGLPYRFGYDHGELDAALQNALDTLRVPVAIDDITEANPLTDILQAGREEGLRSLLVVPACREDGIAGAIAFYKMIGVKCWHNMDISSAGGFFNIFLDACQLKAGCAACGSENVGLQL